MRLAIAQHTDLDSIRAQPVPDVFALAEGLSETEYDKREWEATLAGVTLK